MIEPIILTSSRPPDLNGHRGCAWRLDVPAIARRKPDAPPAELTVAGWIVYAPYAHPAWHSYMIAGVSLRVHPNWQPPHIRKPGATHEILVVALNPEHPTAINDHPRILTPLNFVAQLIETDDQAAAARIEATVQDVIDGVLNPDTDYIRHWIHRFGDDGIKPEFRATAGETRIIAGDVELVVPPQPGPQDLH
jgi:hypothetical protein